ncbi:DUF2624 domain-containing protein [Virgibacillus kekensis]|uniref:DUF2624 domain-containing protein n=1 Tax=Virgibacillus kekensis TaxID=202261 RepID=A0ABV9DL80_9BACI
MTNFIKDMAAKKIKQLSPDDLLHYSKQYGFSISKQQAEQITSYLKTSKADIFNNRQREKMFKDLAKITDAETARKAKKLFNELIRTYGLEHLFS